MRRPLTAAAGVAVILAATAALASPQGNVQTTAPKPPHKGAGAVATAPAAAPVWTVDKAASRLTFRASANGEAFDGVFKTWDAQIAFDPRNLKASHAVVTVALASAVTGDPTRDQMLPTGDWFDVGKFGKSVFETTSIAEAGPNRYVANGTLTLHGVKRPLSLPFTLIIDKDVARMDGTAAVNRMDFGVGHGQAGGPETVSPQVTVTVKLTARKGH